MALLSTEEFITCPRPDRAIMLVSELSKEEAHTLAKEAVMEARKNMPKLTGEAASRLEPIYGTGFFGIYWPDNYTWFQDHGIKAFTMNSLQGKLIPMWVADPTGAERQKNPKIKVRVTEDGRTQVLIFRRAAMKGAKKQVFKKDRKTGKQVLTETPASYPGAPGRINTRQVAGALSPSGAKIGGQIAAGNVGVRWRHPGLSSRMFINNGITMAAQRNGIFPRRVYMTDVAWRGRIDA